MKKSTLFIALALLAYFVLTNPELLQGPGEPVSHDVSLGQGNSRLVEAYENRRSDVQVSGQGTVTRILSDDNDGSRHQRFILRLSGGQTVLVAHNIDLAPRVASIATGDTVEFYGVYEWNDRGGVIHWTHHDPRGQHVGGWLKHRGRTYQ